MEPQKIDLPTYSPGVFVTVETYCQGWRKAVGVWFLALALKIGPGNRFSLAGKWALAISGQALTLPPLRRLAAVWFLRASLKMIRVPTTSRLRRKAGGFFAKAAYRINREEMSPDLEVL